MPSTNPTLIGKTNQRLNQLGPNEILAFDTEVSSIEGIIKLTLGEPDFCVPKELKEAAKASIDADESHYSPVTGTLQLRQAIASFLKDLYKLNYDPQTEICVTVGATEGIFVSLEALLNPGDKVLIPTPGFPLYESDTLILGGQAISINTSQDGFILKPERLKQCLDEHPDAKVLVLNYPGNPTGVSYSREELKALADVLADKAITVIADEIYSELCYDTEHCSIAEFLPGQCLILNGASKSHAMTGYRIGFIAGPKELMQKVILCHAYAVTTCANPSMAAAAHAFASPEGRACTQVMKAAYLERRDYLCAELEKLGFEFAKPSGAFYLFVKIPKALNQDDIAFAKELAYEAKLACIAGSYFGPGGESYLRLSYATSMDKLQAAVAQLKAYLERKGLV